MGEFCLDTGTTKLFLFLIQINTYERMSNSPPLQDLFNRIAPVYDSMNDQFSLGLHRVWKRMAVRWSGAQRGQTCLDLCCGSGDLALLLAQEVGSSGRVVGLDFAAQQLAIAQQRSYRLGWNTVITWLEGDALQLPFDNETFDAITMGYGLRNLSDPLQGLREMQRVLKPGAKVALLDFHRPESPFMQQVQQFYLAQLVVPAAQALGVASEYAYIQPSLDRFPQGAEQIILAQQAGFSTAVHYPLVGGMMGILVAAKAAASVFERG
jgi:demethylmenaquinone methyltransferase/2-methoxy-6-polyprenyl-1,4-benzoquinol methylase